MRTWDQAPGPGRAPDTFTPPRPVVEVRLAMRDEPLPRSTAGVTLPRCLPIARPGSWNQPASRWERQFQQLGCEFDVDQRPLEEIGEKHQAVFGRGCSPGSEFDALREARAVEPSQLADCFLKKAEEATVK